MFYFTEYFVKKALTNGVSLIIVSVFLVFGGSGELIHKTSLILLLSTAFIWIYFGLKFKKQLNEIDEPQIDEEEKKMKVFKLADKLLSSILVFAIILTIVNPLGISFYFLLILIAVLFLMRFAQIIMISNYLKQEIRN
jgi:hypothetical protein